MLFSSRNVSIYFDEHTRQNIQHRFNRIMQPEAVLFLGTAETMANDFGLFHCVKAMASTTLPKDTTATSRTEKTCPLRGQSQPCPTAATASRCTTKQRPATPAVSTPLPDLQLISAAAA